MIKINNESLKDFICYNFDVADINEINESEILNLEEIVIDGESEETNSLQDITIFSNLKTISIKNFLITKDSYKQIMLLKNLEKIYFINCKIKNEVELFNSNIKEISFLSCQNLKIKTLANTLEKLSIIDGQAINLEEIENAKNLKELYLQNLKLKDISFIKNLPNLKYLNLNGSVVEPEQIEFLQDSNIQLEYKRKNYYIV